MKTAKELFNKYKHQSDGGEFLYLSQFLKALIEHDKELRDKIKEMIEKNGKRETSDTLIGYKTGYDVALQKILTFIEEK